MEEKKFHLSDVTKTLMLDPIFLMLDPIFSPTSVSSLVRLGPSIAAAAMLLLKKALTGAPTVRRFPSRMAPPMKLAAKKNQARSAFDEGEMPDTPHACTKKNNRC